MTVLTARDRDHVFEALRKGLVPERGLDAFAVGVERARDELGRQLDLAEQGEGSIKFLRGGYGCGKTFMARLAVLDAQRRGFATAFVVVSDNDLKFHRFDEVYRKVVTELATASCPRGALGDVLDRWIGRIEDALIDGGADENAPDFDEQVRRRLEEELASRTQGQAPQDFARVVQAIFDAKQEGELAEAGALLSWLSGSGNVAASARKRAGVKGDIGSRAALDYLRGVVEVVKAAGYKGLLIVIDEAETILRMRKDSRHKSLNGIRQISDASSSYPGLLWLFTGTPEFFDTRHGVAGLAPLHDRIAFQEHGGFASLRQPQIALRPFQADRLRDVALTLRGLYRLQDRKEEEGPNPTDRRKVLEERVSREFVDHLVAQVTAGFKGDVGVVPRQYLREFVTQLDLVDENDNYLPMEVYGFEARELRPEEEWAVTGAMPPVDGEDEELVPEVEAW